MANCDKCGKRIELTYKCRKCDGHFCAEHKSPSEHDCKSDGDGVFQEHHLTLGHENSSPGWGFTSERNTGLGHHRDDDEQESRYDNDNDRKPTIHNEVHNHYGEEHNDQGKWSYGGSGGANLKVIARILIVIAIIGLVSTVGPFHNASIANAAHGFADFASNLYHTFTTNNTTINVSIKTT